MSVVAWQSFLYVKDQKQRVVQEPRILFCWLFFFKLNDQTNSEITSSYVIKEENNRIKELLISLKNKFSKTQIQF